MVATKTATQFEYSFSVWPDETQAWDRAVIELFEALKRRVGLVFTPTEFERFRSGLSHHGITLREIERVPHHEPEPVI